jgi:hypothetical protein
MKRNLVSPERRAVLIDIQIFTGEKEYSCKSCGAVESWLNIEIHEQTFTNTKRHYRALCPHCLTLSKYMLQSKVERIFYKNSMSEVGEFETSLLLWMKKVKYHGIQKKRIMDAVDRELDMRAFKVDPKADIEMSVSEVRQLDRIREVTSDIKKYEDRAEVLRKEMVAKWANLSYDEAKSYETKIKFNKKAANAAYKIKQELLNKQKDEKK